MKIQGKVDIFSRGSHWAIARAHDFGHVGTAQRMSGAFAALMVDQWCNDPTTWSDMFELYEDLGCCRLGPPTTAEVNEWIKPRLRRAFEDGTLVVVEAALLGNSLHGDAVCRLDGTAPNTVALVLKSPANDTPFVIDATPQMPTIDVEASITGLTPDPSSETTFEWTAEISCNPRTAGFRHGPNRTFKSKVSGKQKGGKFQIRFPQIMGGELTITVKATVGEQKISVATTGLKMAGTNPTQADLQAAIGDETLQRIACHESGQRQFDAAPGDVAPSPLWSSDKRGGVGIFQITVPAPSDDQVWNWMSNVAAGRAHFRRGVTAAGNYRKQILGSNTFAGMVKDINVDRAKAKLQPITVEVPAFTDDQIEDDAIRAFNGYGSERDQFGYPLHEFRLVMNGQRLSVQIDETKRIGVAEWERVPVAARGPTGDPNYVSNVRGESLACT